MKIKICGFKRPEDLQQACRLDIDFVGFIFAPSPRKLTLEEANSLSRLVPGHIKKVGVFVNAEKEKVLSTAQNCHLDVVQLHGEETKLDCDFLSAYLTVWKALRVTEKTVWQNYKDYPVEAFLIDTYNDSQYGGTGQRVSFSLVEKSLSLGNTILAGGLDPNNISTVLQEVPALKGVDVSSGVENSPGCKDKEKMIKFVEQVRAWEKNNINKIKEV